MVTISHIVKKIVAERPLLYEALSQGIASYPGVAEKLKQEIEQELGMPVQESAIIMALRRHAEHLESASNPPIPFKFNSEIIMKTGLADITVVKSPTVLSKLKKIYDLIDYDKGETLNVIQGNYEVTVVLSDKHKEKVLLILDGEKIINIEENLVSLALGFSREFMYTPGTLAKVTQAFLWNNINIFENISTMTELIFIVTKKDSLRAYTTLQGLVDAES